MSKKKKNQIGKIFTITGLLLFAAALALSAYNLWDGYRAEQSREKLLEEYRDKNQNISDEGKQADESDGLSAESGDGDAGDRIRRSGRRGMHRSA